MENISIKIIASILKLLKEDDDYILYPKLRNVFIEVESLLKDKNIETEIKFLEDIKILSILKKDVVDDKQIINTDCATYIPKSIKTVFTPSYKPSNINTPTPNNDYDKYKIPLYNPSNINTPNINYDNNTACLKTDKLLVNNGKEFEEKFFGLLKQNYPKFEIKQTGDFGNSGDIQVYDHLRESIFLFELKNKKNITSEDLDKFDSDCENVFNNLEIKYKHFNKTGIFISYLDNNIMRHGEFDINKKKDYTNFYLTRKFVEKKILDIIFIWYLPNKTENNNNKRDIFNFSEKETKMLFDLKNEYSRLESEIESENKVIENLKKSLMTMEELKNHSYGKKIFIENLTKFLNIEESKIVTPRDNIFKYISDNKKFTKKKLLEIFPEHSNFINVNKVSDLIAFSNKKN